MKYDFDKIIPRRDTNSYKWDSMEDADLLPMWVADMDFRTAPVIIHALQQRVEHGIFGYTRVPNAYYDAVTDWFERRHGWKIRKEWIIYTSGVVPAVSAVIKALTVPGDKVLVQTPVYNCFFSSIRNNGCEPVSNPLLYINGTYIVDYKDLERKAADPKVKVLLLCNPHNPVGRVWKREELEFIGKICIQNGVTVLSDEIHCELVYPGYVYMPFASLSEKFLRNSVTCLSPSKAFNIAGLQIANIVAADEEMYKRIDKAININEVCDVNPFGVIATIAAYNEGEDWLTQLLDYLQLNYQCMKDFCAEHLPDFPIAKLEGAYLVWMDCRVLNKPSEELEHLLAKKAKLWLNAGIMYGKEGEGFMRWNIACPRSLLLEGLKRFKNFIHNL
ncbi:MAG: pyridoxal phosphate-dependent aminotransferase [Bacteroidales bacterium]|nr:pyridoxal phosphate-dependent aminotransferase [Bacteroidales bacterium]